MAWSSNSEGVKAFIHSWAGWNRRPVILPNPLHFDRDFKVHAGEGQAADWGVEILLLMLQRIKIGGSSQAIAWYLCQDSTRWEGVPGHGIGILLIDRNEIIRWQKVICRSAFCITSEGILA